MDSLGVELICHTNVPVEGCHASLRGEDTYEVYNYSIMFLFVCVRSLWRCELHRPVKTNFACRQRQNFVEVSATVEALIVLPMSQIL